MDATTRALTVRPKTPSELPELEALLVKQNVELIVAPSSPAVTALKRVTLTIPIVFATTADPVGSGFVANLARPGGNITGFSQLNVELSGKRVELPRAPLCSSRDHTNLGKRALARDEPPHS